MEKLNAKKDYPLAEKRPDLILTPTGKKLGEITMANVLSGDVKAEDCRISTETLIYQSEIASSAGNVQLAQNLKRASELTLIPDERVLEIYEAMRPYRSTKEELLLIAAELEEKYGACINADFIREAAEVYERRKKLKGDK
jgi:propanediol dehydratase small subunit